MKKSLSIGLAMIASILLIFVIAFTTLQQVINNNTFVNNEFTELDVAPSMGMNNADLVSSMTVLVDYMEGDADSIDIMVTVDGQKVQMFELEQERVHMADVRDIYQKIRGYRDIAALALLVLYLFAALISFRQAPQTLAQGYLFGAFVMVVFFGFIGTWAAMDFSSFWTFFHEALFWNNLWLFDATESRMINMLPEQMFANIISRMGLYAGLAVGALLVLSILALIFTSERYKRSAAAAKEAREKRRAYRRNRAALLEQKRREAEAEKRKAAKRAAREAARQKAEAVAEKERIAAEKAAAAAEQARQKALEKKRQNVEMQRQNAEKQRVAAEKSVQRKTVEKRAADPRREPAIEMRESAPSPKAQKAPSKAKPSKARPAAAKPKKKPRSNITDDTGFFDE